MTVEMVIPNEISPMIITKAVKTISYAKPGDAIDQSFPHLFDLAAGKEIPLEHSVWDNPWANDHGAWSADGTVFRFVHNRRGHQVFRRLLLLELEPAPPL